MSNNINENNFILALKDTNKECSMKVNYSLLMILSITELCIEIFFFPKTLQKLAKGLIILILISFLSILHLLFSIYYSFKFKIFSRTRKEIISKTNLSQIKSYKKVTKSLMSISIFISILYYLYIFYNICFNDKIVPSCEALLSMKTFDKILSLKKCQNNKCYNIKSNFENFKYRNNYLCNINLGDYSPNKEENNKIECANIPKKLKKGLFLSSKAFSKFFREKNNIISQLLYNFMISCDYDFKKELYVCNVPDELKENENGITNIEIINDYNKVSSIDDDFKGKKEDYINNYQDNNGGCITMISFVLSIILNLIIFFTLPIKVDIWFNESRRFEIIKKQIHPNRLRVRVDGQNDNNNLDVFSESTDDNSSDKSSDSSISDNGQRENNILESIIQI